MSEHGVETSRLAAQGYGETLPVDDNETRSGRANNRRVEFKILEEAERVQIMREDEVPEGVESTPVDEESSPAESSGDAE